MDKLKMHTENKVDINIEKIGSLFPNTLTEKIKGYDENKVFRIIDEYEYDVLPADPKEFISTYIQEFDEYLLNDIKDFIRKNGLPSVQCEINNEIFTFPNLRPLK